LLPAGSYFGDFEILKYMPYLYALKCAAEPILHVSEQNRLESIASLKEVNSFDESKQDELLDQENKCKVMCLD
jgi:hypothetical protein